MIRYYIVRGKKGLHAVGMRFNFVPMPLYIQLKDLKFKALEVRVTDDWIRLNYDDSKPPIEVPHTLEGVWLIEEAFNSIDLKKAKLNLDKHPLLKKLYSKTTKSGKIKKVKDSAIVKFNKKGVSK